MDIEKKSSWRKKENSPFITPNFFCCKNCTDRKIGCHANCKKYLDAKQKSAKFEKHKREEMQKDKKIKYSDFSFHVMYKKKN